jgi:hypothetical protein
MPGFPPFDHTAAALASNSTPSSNTAKNLFMEQESYHNGSRFDESPDFG